MKASRIKSWLNSSTALSAARHLEILTANREHRKAAGTGIFIQATRQAQDGNIEWPFLAIFDLKTTESLRIEVEFWIKGPDE